MAHGGKEDASKGEAGEAVGGAPGIEWLECGAPCCALWRSAAGSTAPVRVSVADDHLRADAAYRLACAGTALLWRGDFQNARQLLQAMARRVDGRRGKARTAEAPSLREAFHRYRLAQAQRARILAQLLIPVQAGHVIALRRAPDVGEACAQALGPAEADYVMSLRDLLGIVGAYEWRKKGVAIAALGARIHPHYGVFSPVRGEYVDLVAEAPLPQALAACNVAFDIGTGTGVLAAVLARRGVAQVVATDQDARALACARENLARLAPQTTVEVLPADLFPPGQAALVVCNPPWLPGRPASPLDHAVFDPDSRMLRGFLAGVRAHLAPGGEAWLIISDLAEHLGLRTRDELPALIAGGGLQVLARHTVRPRHGRASDPDDPLFAARAAEVTSLWRLGALS